MICQQAGLVIGRWHLFSKKNFNHCSAPEIEQLVYNEIVGTTSSNTSYQPNGPYETGQVNQLQGFLKATPKLWTYFYFAYYYWIAQEYFIKMPNFSFVSFCSLILRKLFALNARFKCIYVHVQWIPVHWKQIFYIF